MISAPINRKNTLKFIQLSQVNEEQIIAVIVMGGNVIKNKIIDVNEELGSETLLKLNMLLNTTLNGMSIEEINLGLIARLKEQAGIHSQVISNVPVSYTHLYFYSFSMNFLRSVFLRSEAGWQRSLF